MSVPNEKEARAILGDCLGHYPPAIAHAENAALVARCVAERVKGLEPATAHVLGLLHDVGRKFDLTSRHTVEGYTYLSELGYDDAARICITHEYYEPFYRESIDNSRSLEDEDKSFMTGYLDGISYGDYDFLIELADLISHPQGICRLETRLVDLILRGKYPRGFPRLHDHWSYFYQIKNAFEQRMGCGLYDVLPRERLWAL